MVTRITLLWIKRNSPSRTTAPISSLPIHAQEYKRHLKIPLFLFLSLITFTIRFRKTCIKYLRSTSTATTQRACPSSAKWSSCSAVKSTSWTRESWKSTAKHRRCPSTRTIWKWASTRRMSSRSKRSTLRWASTTCSSLSSRNAKLTHCAVYAVCKRAAKRSVTRTTLASTWSTTRRRTTARPTTPTPFPPSRSLCLSTSQYLSLPRLQLKNKWIMTILKDLQTYKNYYFKKK